MPDLSKCSNEEIRFFEEVIRPTLGEEALEKVCPQYSVAQADGRIRRIDFAITSSTSKIAIEMDGFTYHAEGQVSPDKFSDDLHRQNELALAGWKVLRFAWGRVLESPAQCQDQLRRAIIHDPELHPSLRTRRVEPHLIQQEVLLALDDSRRRGYRRGLVVMATGLGKTFLSAFDAKRMGGRILFIVHNNSILEQSREAYRQVFPDRSTGMCNGYEKVRNADIVFANIATLRQDENCHAFRTNDFDYIVVDEFHHGAADGYQKVLSYFKPKFMLGLTATPNRTDSASILRHMENNLVYGITQAEAIDKGFLTPFKYLGLKDDIDYSTIRHNGFRYDLKDLDRHLIIEKRDLAIISKYKELAPGAKAIAFCVSIDHAERAAGRFTAGGVPSVAIHSRLAQEVRAKRIAEFRAGVYQIVFVRDIFNEGIDFPDVSALLFMRPTESKVVFTQQLGRGLRISPAKHAVTVLDFIGNYRNADKILGNLREAGAHRLSIEELHKKPILHFDNGCDVQFEQATIDTITSILEIIPTDNALVKETLDVYLKLGRSPSVSDLMTHGRYTLQQYISVFGSWLGFLTRLHQLEPELDVERLKSDTLLKAKNLDECGDFIEINASAFRSMLREAGSNLRSIHTTFVAMGRLFLTDDQFMLHLVHFNDFLNQGRGLLDELSIILSFRFPTDPPPKGQAPVSADPSFARIARKLLKVRNCAEAHIFPQICGAGLSQIHALLHAVDRYFELEQTGEVEILAEISRLAQPCHRLLTDLSGYSERFVREVPSYVLDLDLPEDERALLAPRKLAPKKKNVKDSKKRRVGR